MGIFNFSKKKEEARPKNLRILVEERLDANYMPSEIAEDLQIDIKEVYNIQQAKKRRERTMSSAGVDDTDEVAALRREIEKAKLADQLAEIEHRNYIREMERKEYEGDDYEDIAEAANSPDKLMQMIFMKALMGGANTGNSNPIINPVSVTPIAPTIEANVPPIEVATPKNLKEAEVMIKEGKLSEQDVIDYALRVGLSEKSARNFYAHCKK